MSFAFNLIDMIFSFFVFVLFIIILFIINLTTTIKKNILNFLFSLSCYSIELKLLIYSHYIRDQFTNNNKNNNDNDDEKPLNPNKRARIHFLLVC